MTQAANNLAVYIKDNLEAYVCGFSRGAREIFEYFKFDEFIGQLSNFNLLYKVVQKVRGANLSPERISYHEMGRSSRAWSGALLKVPPKRQVSTSPHVISSV